jgi:G protein-coupled receptor kinase interactor 2
LKCLESRRKTCAPIVGIQVSQKIFPITKFCIFSTSPFSPLPDPSWASVNRGIYLCSECCSIHRSIGRHISQIKSLRQGQWSPSIRQLVNQLNVHANQIWEHTLLDATSSKSAKRKPSPKDALHPVKADFIRAKHVNLAYVLKPQQGDDVSANDLETELSKQLHASVRTANLEVSLRLLIQGADPNFYHEEKGTSPLHVAAKFGQPAQCELLIVYGADLLALDAKGLSAMDLANANKHAAIAERLLEAMYEVTDRISFFICGKKPDHSVRKVTGRFEKWILTFFL